jgi:hypothetical protein
VNLEPLDCARSLELAERQAPAFRPGSRKVHSYRRASIGSSKEAFLAG